MTKVTRFIWVTWVTMVTWVTRVTRVTRVTWVNGVIRLNEIPVLTPKYLSPSQLVPGLSPAYSPWPSCSRTG